ncbi:hypothetical protein CHS0354_006602 [Potamilus streckersoni]|uniref:Uncharacterized protein n=1 Tax=Potamilus streckersoni TaxID=2493646 RepID=A0AAE0SX82_9BIVA|nr:hypothetical protein CHS0354_006602 [Potamilus streckersoni]
MPWIQKHEDYFTTAIRHEATDIMLPAHRKSICQLLDCSEINEVQSPRPADDLQTLKEKGVPVSCKIGEMIDVSSWQ